MEKVKKMSAFLIILLLVLIIIVGILLTIFSNIFEEKETDYYENTEFEKNNVYENQKELQYVKVPSKYYEVKRILNDYIQNCNNYLKYDASDINDAVFTEEEKQAYIEEMKKEWFDKLDAIIADDYSKKDKMESIIKEYEADSIDIEEMYVAEESASINIFLIYGFIGDVNQKVSFMVVTDSENSSYKIYPEEYMREKSYSSLQQGDSINYECKKIEANQYNRLQYINISEETIIKDYFSIYKNLMFENFYMAYDLLDSEYRNIRFNDTENFKKYINNNNEELQNSMVKQYVVNKYENFIEYVCKDQYDNLYIFKATAVMQYSVQLDTYTIETDKFKATYENSNDQGKVMLNIDKWRQMINNRDYHAAYEVLDETFRNNYFGSEEKFEQYMRQSYPLHYSAQYVEFSNEGNTYIQKIQLSDITGEDTSTKEMKIVMRLNEEGTGFTMSFT